MFILVGEKQDRTIAVDLTNSHSERREDWQNDSSGNCFRMFDVSTHFFFFLFSDTNISMTVHHENKSFNTGKHNVNIFCLWFYFPALSSFAK